MDAAGVVDEVAEPAIAVGSLAARIMAAVLDYVVIALLVTFGPGGLGSWTALVGGIVYFTVLGSELGGGSTLGKRLVGLKVVRITDGGLRLLTPLGAAVRYMSVIGVLVVAAELPPALYRHWGVVGRVPLLELHMLPVLGYLVANVLRLIFDPVRQGLHDRMCRTLVVRIGVPTDARSGPGEVEALMQHRLPRPLDLLIPLFGATSGGLFWVLGISQPPQLESLMALRYRIEHEFPVRIIGVSVDGTERVVEAIQPPDGAASADPNAIAARVLQLLMQYEAPNSPPWDTLKVKLTLPTDIPGQQDTQREGAAHKAPPPEQAPQ